MLFRCCDTCGEGVCGEGHCFYKLHDTEFASTTFFYWFQFFVCGLSDLLCYTSTMAEVALEEKLSKKGKRMGR